MKRLLLILTVLVLMYPAQAITYNCTAIGQEIVVPDCVCSPGACPACPEPWNVTIGNLTIPNITCKYDLGGIAESVQGCVDSLGTCRDQLQDCDNQMVTQGFQNQSLLKCQQDLLNANREVKDTEEKWKQYCIIAAGIAAAAVWYYLGQKTRPVGAGFKTERE